MRGDGCGLGECQKMGEFYFLSRHVVGLDQVVPKKCFKMGPRWAKQAGGGATILLGILHENGGGAISQTGQGRGGTSREQQRTTPRMGKIRV